MQLSELEAVLKKYWGYDSFRPLQPEIIQSVLEGRDTLGLMPTGGGKSITFQVPGLILDGLTIVVTPLISLMKDQVDNLKKRGVKAVYFHSGMSLSENRITWERLVKGRAKFLYTAPERLKNERFLDELRHLKVSLIVVDEAHCISQWGYDFRPSYLGIKVLRKYFPDAPVLALTATATPEVAQDICRNLEFRKDRYRCYRKSFVRDNISYVTRESATKINDVFHILSCTSGSSIVYVRSRKRTREIAEYLCNAGVSATFYHAGLDFDSKAKRQNAWQEGEVRVMVATNAFGMGIDKPDVRVVIHYDLPPSLEEYYQEAGRAGRDGKESFAVVLFFRNDRSLLRRRVSEAFPSREYILKIYERVCIFLNLAIGEGYNKVKEFDIDLFVETFSLQKRQCEAALHILSRAGYIDYIEETENASRITMLVDREELYQVKGLSKSAGKVLDKSLRLYTGLFIDYAFISEDKIARETGLSSQQVYEAFLELSKSGVMHYVPRKRIPYIYMPTSREETRHVNIGKAIYEDRKENLSRRVEAMIDYVYNDRSCRVERMLAYFGEDDSGKCRKCDICRNRSHTPQEKRASQESLIENLTTVINSHPSGVSLTTLSMQTGGKPEEIGSLLNYMCSEGFVVYKDSLFFPV